MPYCSKCGVELNLDAQACVLCATPVQFPPTILLKDNEKPYPVIPTIDNDQGILAWIVLSTILCLASCTLISVNLFTSRDLNWCVYPVSGLVTAWIYATIVTFLIHNYWIAISGWILSTVSFLAVLNFFGTGNNWFWPLGFPLTILSGLAIMIIVRTIKHLKSVSAIMAIIFATATVLCVCIDFAVNRFLGRPGIGWSIIVISAIIPTEIGLAAYYSFIRKHIDLRRYFHI